MTLETGGASGSGKTQGELWGSKPKDWAEIQEGVCRPLFEALLGKIGVGPGTALLDVGCGSGMFCALAAERGAVVSGFDASSHLLAIARERTPRSEFRVGEMEALPYPDNTFDAVTGLNSFQYAANPVRALRDAQRVARSGAFVAMAVWGRKEDCEAAAYLAALRAVMPPPPPGAPGPFALSEDGGLRALVVEAGLRPVVTEDVSCPFVYPDAPTALRGLLSAGPAIRAIRHSGEERVREATLQAIAPFRKSSGAYRMENRFRYLIAQVTK